MRYLPALLLPLLILAPSRATEPTFTAEQLAFYTKQVQPILKASCLKCHGEGKVRGGLDLTNRAAILKGGDLGPAVNLNHPKESNLLKAINYTEGLEMPPTGKLPAEQRDILTMWVNAGLPMPEGKQPAAKPREQVGGKVTAEAKAYWAYQPLRRPIEPKPSDPAWVRNPIDAFILAKLDEKKLTPTHPAEKVALIRRLYYDLIGLPPTPADVDAFVNDSAPNAYEKLIDRLLESPHYGEKWGRHWLDLVRYAESNGYERDGTKPYAWRYRDYVIRSFNSDKPFDRFIREQLAGDELPGDDPDSIIATGFLRLGLWDDEPADPLQARFDELDDLVATTSQVFLGMTLNCARCHEHKIDPIPHADYYRMLAFFTDIPRYSYSNDPTTRTILTDISPPEQRKVYEAELRERQKVIAALERMRTLLENEVIKTMPASDQRLAETPQRKEVLKRLDKFASNEQKSDLNYLTRRIDELKRKPLPKQELALSVTNCRANPEPTHLLIRGNPHAPGVRVEPGFPEVLGFPDPKIAPAGREAKSSGRRSVLANWIASRENPLTARVLMNRVWQYHFGRGIVATPNDFGKFGDKPTHPELLDWLASEFQDGGWTLKRMHRLILTSNTYRQSARGTPEAVKLDPANFLLARFPMRRLTAEEVRDSFLAVSGTLNPAAGGPSVYPEIPREVLQGQSRPGDGWGRSSPRDAAKRSVYVFVKRSLQVPILINHDQADTDSSCPVRYTTTVPTQALGMLNSEFSVEQARFFAERLEKQADDLAGRVRTAIRLTTGRQPSVAEVAKDCDFIRSIAKEEQLTERRALEVYTLLLLNTNEFLYLD